MSEILLGWTSKVAEVDFFMENCGLKTDDLMRHIEAVAFSPPSRFYNTNRQKKA